MSAEYHRGYCRANVSPSGHTVWVSHKASDTRSDIARAARECNYLAGNWNKKRLVHVDTFPIDGINHMTGYAVISM